MNNYLKGMVSVVYSGGGSGGEEPKREKRYMVTENGYTVVNPDALSSEKPWPSPEDIVRMRHESKPPTREDWREWATIMAKIILWRHGYAEGEIVNAVLSMPGIPKE
jgi:hypothetical protein